ncbi:plasmid mobilization protein [Robiginitalea aurantiaca]
MKTREERKSERLFVRLTKDEKLQVRELALLEGKTISNYIREAIL